MLVYLLLLFTLVPIVEIWVLIRIGQAISAGPTIALIVLTGVVGAALARREGLRTLARINESLSRGVMPATEMIEGLLIFAAGVTLVTPGVITDAFGFAVLLPPVRAWLGRRVTEYCKAHVVLMDSQPGANDHPDSDFIDVQCRDVTDGEE